jgi:hypothetical protein
MGDNEKATAKAEAQVPDPKESGDAENGDATDGEGEDGGAE